MKAEKGRKMDTNTYADTYENIKDIINDSRFLGGGDFSKDKALEQNPFEQHSLHYLGWRLGWLEAQQDVGGPNPTAESMLRQLKKILEGL